MSWKLFFKLCQTLKNVTNFLCSLNAPHSVNWARNQMANQLVIIFALCMNVLLQCFGDWGFFTFSVAFFIFLWSFQQWCFCCVIFSKQMKCVSSNYLWTWTLHCMFPAMHCKLLVPSHQNGEHGQYWGFYNYSIWNKFLNLTVSYLEFTVCKAFVEIVLYNAAKFQATNLFKDLVRYIWAFSGRNTTHLVVSR